MHNWRVILNACYQARLYLLEFRRAKDELIETFKILSAFDKVDEEGRFLWENLELAFTI